MLATTPLFYAYNWPRTALARITRSKPRNSPVSHSESTTTDVDHADNDDDDDKADDGGDDAGDDLSRATANTTIKVCRENHVRWT